MQLRRSEFSHLIALDETRTLAIHAISQRRVTVTPEVARLIGCFDAALDLDAALPLLAAEFGYDAASIRACVLLLHEQGILSEQSAEQDRHSMGQALAAERANDPATMLDRYRRAHLEGSHPYWAVEAPRAIGDRVAGRRLDVLLFGDCDIQMETDFLRQEAAGRGIDLHVAASFADDTALAGERAHDAIIIGALQARHAITLGEMEHHGGDPSRVYVDTVRSMLDRLRALSAAPILVNGLPEPTVQPLGVADRGVHSHRNRFRKTNLALEALAESCTDVYLVDVAGALGSAGAAALLDDGLVGFTHFGSIGWMLQRPEQERAAVHHQFPCMQSLAAMVGGDPYRQQTVLASAHMDLLSVVLGLDRKKCVIVDLDGVLWPGVLAETGSPFAWSPEVSSPNSFIGLYFGIHEALLALRRRGILLACVSKNDEATIRALWRYPDHYPRHRLLTPERFVTWRVNWSDKAENIRSIANELGFSLDAFLFVDDSARERERIRQSLPEVAVLGGDLFTLRRTLLTDPRLQVPSLTAESARRGELVQAQLDRASWRAAATSDRAFIESLEVDTKVGRLHPRDENVADMQRVRELFERTTQFNATGRKFTESELRHLIDRQDGRVFTLRMRDRFADHGLVGAAVVVAGEILNIAMSCRVIGLGGERVLLAMVADDANRNGWDTNGCIIATDRNTPVRHVYRDQGFTQVGENRWTLPVTEQKHD